MMNPIIFISKLPNRQFTDENVSTPKTMVSVNAAESQRLLRNNQILQVAYQNDRKDCYNSIMITNGK